MYIQKAEIKNIRSIERFEIDFENPAGWHVLIGDNGAGKSTIIRSMALVLVGFQQSAGLRANWKDWLNHKESSGEIRLKGVLSNFPNNDVNNNLGFAYRGRGELEKAEQLYTETLEIQRKLGDQLGIANALHNLGNLLRDKGELEKAERFYLESLQIRQILSDQLGIASSLHNLGNLLRDKGELEKAEQFYLESFQISQKLGNQSGVANALHNLGNLLRDKGELEKAEQFYLESLQINQKLGDQRAIANALHNLGNLLADKGELEKAEQFYLESLLISRKLGDQLGIAAVLNNLGNLLNIKGESEKAKQFYAESLDIQRNINNQFETAFRFTTDNSNTVLISAVGDVGSSFESEFSAAYGPYRRFKGGDSRWDELFSLQSYDKLAAHLSVFGEDVALTEAINWLIGLNYESLESNTKSRHTLENLKKLINSEDFLPHNTKLESVSSEGVFFKDGNDTTISVNQMSDGYRSILSMTFELIRQLVRIYGAEMVFKNIEKDEMIIALPGVVLVDEIDAHLHPTWQTRIGQWFLKYFPKLQFIVTTHSPLVCRAAETGSIWRLAAPGSDEKSGEVTGIDRERLIYGNILDAYGTEVFGEDVSISHDSVEKQEVLVKLSKKKMLDAISPEEEKLQDLKKVFTTDAPIEL